MQREHRFLPLVISLFAGLVVSVLMIVRRNYSLTSVIIILSFLLLFYILGLIFRAILIKNKTPEPDLEEVVQEEKPDVTTEESEKDEV